LFITHTKSKIFVIPSGHNIKKLPVILNNEIVGIITETDITRTICASAMAIDELTELYYNSKETLEKMIDDWGNVIVSLKNFKNDLSDIQNNHSLNQEKEHNLQKISTDQNS
jgi:signal-transduction protein with cAMP-binding, CBS, and nucleotidyltransferase domain